MNAEFVSSETVFPGLTRRSSDVDRDPGMERLLQAMRELSLARSLPDVQRIVCVATRELTGCDGATFVIRDGGECHCTHEESVAAPLWKGSRLPLEECVSGWSVLNREVFVIPDVHRDPRMMQAVDRPSSVTSLVVVPIGDLDPVGVIGIYCMHQWQPSELELSRLRALADATSIAMENIAVHLELEQRVRDRTAALEKASEKAEDEINEHSVINGLTGLSNQGGLYSLAEMALHSLVFNSLHDQIAVIDPQGTIVAVNAAWTRFGIENGHSASFEWVGRNYLKALSGAHRQGDADAGEALTGILEVVNDQLASFYCEYPCHSPDEKRWFMMRVIPLQNDSLRFFAISHQDITRRKLAEERAEHHAMHDPLTEVANRRYFNKTLDREFRRSRRAQSPISLIALDIDDFKGYNDGCGHLAGDRCLAQVAQVLVAFARRPNDLAARLGGDEFAVILGDTDFVQSRRIAQEIVKSVSDLGIGFGETAHVTVSAGVATMIPHKHQPGKSLHQEADKALYGAKQAGRNRALHAHSFADEGD